MKTAVALVYELLNSTQLFNDVDIHTNAIPDSALTSSKLPIARICEIQGNYSDFVSDNPLSITFSIQLDIWVESLQEVEKYYYEVDKIMRDNGWNCIYSEQADGVDLPQTKRIIKRYLGTLEIEL